MQAPALPSCEGARLAALLEARVLDTPPEERFDRITRLAKRVLGVKIALVSLIDQDRQWFKSRQGLAAQETPRTISFCGHAILGERIFEVPDASADPRFAENPLVLGEPRIRFYAGAPIFTSTGFAAGTLCIIDEAPRRLSADERLILRDLADLVEQEIEISRQRSRRQALEVLAEITTHATDDPQEAMRAAVTAASAFLAMPFAVVGRRDGAMYRILLHGGETGELREGASLPAEETLCASIVDQTAVHVFDERSVEACGAEGAPAPPRAAGFGKIGCYLGVPLELEGGARGALGFYAPEAPPGGLGAAEIEFAERLGRWVARSLGRWEVDRRLERQRRLSELIATAQAEFIRHDGLDAGLHRLLSGALELTQCGLGFFVTLDPPAAAGLTASSGSARLATAARDSAHDRQSEVCERWAAPSDSLLGKVLASGDPLILDDEKAQADPTPIGLPAAAPPIANLLALPVRAQDETIALLVLANRSEGIADALLTLTSPLVAAFAQLVDAARERRERQDERKKLDRLSRVASETSDAVIITDPDGRIEWVNDGFQRLTGYSEAEAVGRRPGPLLQGADTDPAVVGTMREALRRREPFVVEIVNYAKDGAPYWLRINCSPLWRPDGSLEGFMAIESDLTKERAAAAQIEENEKRLSTVIDSTGVGTWVWDMQTDARVYNDRYCELLGYPPDQYRALGPTAWRARLHPDDARGVDQAFAAHLRGDAPFYAATYRMRRKDGSWILIHDRGRVSDWTADGRPVQMSGIHSDVTREKEFEISLQRSETLLRGLFELSPVGIALNDFDTGAFVDVNAALLRATGYDRKTFLTLSSWDLTPVEYGPQEAEQRKALESAGRYGPYEKEYVRKDGKRFPVLLNGLVVRDLAGRRLIWSIIEDISERKRTERLKAEFVSTVSHEIRTPLTALSGSIGLVQGSMADAVPPPMRKLLDIAQKNAMRLNRLVDDLLDFEKLTAGKMVLDRQMEDLCVLVREAVEENEAYARRYGVRYEIACAPASIRAPLDGYRLKQVLANLLSNGAKFSPTGAVVSVAVAEKDAWARVSVTDCGAGVPDDFKDRLFEKFSQADGSDSREKGGTGLGLAISRQLIDLMGGAIGVADNPAGGAVFFFDLPLSEDDEP
ncbi:MAG: PAS domain S-box protein [Marivibrio sp.]|uniref:PAS domain S-box protein n=1 Tax=Marivibrio sp. TaxID=2039719 RepID=UPI0032EC379B